MKLVAGKGVQNILEVTVMLFWSCAIHQNVIKERVRIDVGRGEKGHS